MRPAHYTRTQAAIRNLREALAGINVELDGIMPHLEKLADCITASKLEQDARKSWLFPATPVVANLRESLPIAHVMWDVETLSTQPNALVLSIGAVCLDANLTPVLKRSWNVDYSSTDKHIINQRFDLDLSTITWWMGQEEAARRKITSPDMRSTFRPEAICRQIRDLCADNPDGWAGVCVWGNGAAFDLPIMRHFMEVFDGPTPWKFFNEMCFRTMKALYSFVQKPIMNGVAHGALDDAVHQAEHLKIMSDHGI
jgi:hypothetical protein